MAVPAYRAYGLALRSDLRLPFPRLDGGPVDAEIVRGSAALFEGARREIGEPEPPPAWEREVRLRDGGWYLRWSGLFECLLSAGGRRVVYRPLPGALAGGLETYLLGHVLSFVLLACGEEPLHATAVVVGGHAAALVGDCGYGKSTLAAAFLAAGHRLLTDDLFVVRRGGEGFVAFPGAPRIKLLPEVARALLGEASDGVPMNHLTRKLVIPLRGRAAAPPAAPVPLAAIYALVPPGRTPPRRVSIRRLSARRAFVELCRGTFNVSRLDRARLERQFALATDLACTVPVKTLSYPRDLARLPAVCAAVEADAFP